MLHFACVTPKLIIVCVTPKEIIVFFFEAESEIFCIAQVCNTTMPGIIFLNKQVTDWDMTPKNEILVQCTVLDNIKPHRFCCDTFPSRCDAVV